MKSVYLMGCSIVLCAGTATSSEALASSEPVAVQETFQESGQLSAEIERREIEVSISSGTVVATAEEIGLRNGIERPQHVVAWSEEIDIPDAGWVRLRFGEVHLAPGSRDARESYLRVTSLYDGYEQYLDADALVKWRGTSAYFNGGAVRIELMVSPTADAGNNDIEITSVTASEPTRFDRSLCGIDDRILSDDPREARIMPIGCTGWLFGDQGNSMLTAGHCNMGNGGDVIQFNVPLSSSGGTPQSPPPQDQYPVDLASIQDVSPSLGNDWAFFGVFDNTDTGLTPLDAQGDSFELATSLPPLDGRTIRITGFGSTVSPVPASWYLAQKTHTGPLFNYSGNIVRYTVDTSGGNSGGSVFDEVNQDVIAIHTNAGCEGVGGNQGCSIMNPGLQVALANPQGITLPRGLNLGLLGDPPSVISPAGGDSMLLGVAADNGLSPSGSVMMHVDTGGGFSATTMNEVSPGLFEGLFPMSDCGSFVQYYFSETDTDGGVWTFPATGADSALSVLSANDLIVSASDSFETDTGWTVSSSGLSTGEWERGTPGNFGRNDPVIDADGSGRCYVTGNTSQEDVDGGPTTLISPVYDLTGISSPIVEYARWYVTDTGDDFLSVEFSDDGGGSWVFAEEMIGTNSDWVDVAIAVEDHVAITDQFMVRFRVSDNPNNSISEAGVDAFSITSVVCDDACGADFTGDGVLDIFDVFAYLDAFNAGDSIADYTGDGVFDIFDVFAYLDVFNAGCP